MRSDIAVNCLGFRGGCGNVTPVRPPLTETVAGDSGGGAEQRQRSCCSKQSPPGIWRGGGAGAGRGPVPGSAPVLQIFQQSFPNNPSTLSVHLAPFPQNLSHLYFKTFWRSLSLSQLFYWRDFCNQIANKTSFETKQISFVSSLLHKV